MSRTILRDMLLSNGSVRFLGLTLLATALIAITAVAYAVEAKSMSNAEDLTKHIQSPELTNSMASAEGRFKNSADLRLPHPDSFELPSPLRTEGGTISFWTKPHWAKGSMRSHSFLTGTWSGPRKSYLAISEGWWEPGGSGRLYFVVSNEDYIHCSTDLRLPTEMWSLVTVTWASGDRGHCKLYVDDELRATVTGLNWKAQMSLERVNIGNDTGVSDSRQRKADATVAELKILDYPETHKAVIERYRAEEDPSASDEKKWSWLNSPIERGTTLQQKPEKNFKWVMFDEDPSWAVSQASVDDRIERLSKAGFRVYVPCVWHGGGSSYPTALAPADKTQAQIIRSGWDPLAYLIARAHERGIEVHPWFTVARREDNAHPEWAGSGVPDGAYDFHSAGFRKYIVDLMMDVVTRYDVDGINLDYIRTMGVCMSPACQADYRQRMGGDLKADHANGAPTPTAKSRIQAWQDSAVADVVQQFSLRAKLSKPRVFISVDGNVTSTDGDRPLEGRDEIRWANLGWIDAIFHMDYQPTLNWAVVDAARARLENPSKLWLLIGNYDMVDDIPTPRSGDWLARFLAAAKSREYGQGIGVYLFNHFTEEQVDALSTSAKNEVMQSQIRPNPPGQLNIER